MSRLPDVFFSLELQTAMQQSLSVMSVGLVINASIGESYEKKAIRFRVFRLWFQVCDPKTG